MDLNPQIFREYDIRGIVGPDLHAEVARFVGHAYGSALREACPDGPRAVVGRDNRPSSPDLQDGLIRGVRAAGVEVLDVGTVPTPLVYWTEQNTGAEGSLQVTGSHNPPEYNGIKMTVRGRPLYGRAIQDLLRRVQEGNLVAGSGGSRRRDVIHAYVADLASRIQLQRRMRVAVDCGNGTGSVVAVSLLETIGAEVIPLYCESDGTFPNHHPDPTVDENLVDLIELVRDTGADLGVAFDGDADRLGAVDERGTVVRADVLLLLFGLDILQRRGPGQKMVFDVKCSQVLPQVYTAAGGEAVMWKTGHSLMKEKMRALGAPLAGELSGHLCFADDYLGFDDALYAACRLLDLLARGEAPLSARTEAFPRFVSTPEIRIETTEEAKFGIVERALEHFRERYDVIDVDGVRILFGDGWGLLRASNTQPVIVARFEAVSRERLEEIRSQVEDWLRGQGVDV
jgi:phosphomannomutase/phosphoglucomutase